MQRLSATRSELLARRARIRLAGERDLLKERRGALVHEFNRLGASALASIDLLDRDAADAGRFLGMTVAADGQEPVESAACAAQREVELSLRREASPAFRSSSRGSGPCGGLVPAGDGLDRHAGRTSRRVPDRAFALTAATFFIFLSKLA
jgi:hypothetical protein